jgi:hypothetical protein
VDGAYPIILPLAMLRYSYNGMTAALSIIWKTLDEMVDRRT